MQTTAQIIQSIKDDIKTLLDKIDGNEFQNKSTTNTTTGDILPELCVERRVPRKWNKSLR